MIPVFHEALAAHMILMSFGVPAKDIYVSPDATSPEGRPHQLAVIVRQGGFEFTITVGDCQMESTTFLREWVGAVSAVHAMTNEEARRLRDTSRIRERAVEIAAAYQVKRLAWETNSACRKG